MLLALYWTRGWSDHILSFERFGIWKADISYESQKTNFTQAETLCDIHGMKAWGTWRQGERGQDGESEDGLREGGGGGDE